MLVVLDGVIMDGRGHSILLYLENKKWLPYYSKFFKFVEVDSTFYNIPSKFVVQGWKEKLRMILNLH